MTTTASKRRPVEAIEHRITRSAECERKVRAALTKLTKTRAPFTVEDVCTLAGVGKTFIYDKRRPELTKSVLQARDSSKAAQVACAGEALDRKSASWRERATNAEALVETLRAAVKDRDGRISDLTGQLYDPDGNHLAEHNAELRKRIYALNENLRAAEIENNQLRRSLDAARSNVKRERERNVTQLFTQDVHR